MGLQVLSAVDQTQVHGRSLRTLQNTDVRVDTERAKVVCPWRDLVGDCLALAPMKLTLETMTLRLAPLLIDLDVLRMCKRARQGIVAEVGN
jgi:hypothetical protein